MTDSAIACCSAHGTRLTGSTVTIRSGELNYRCSREVAPHSPITKHEQWRVFALSIGQQYQCPVIEDQPLAMKRHCGDHVILDMAALMHNQEPDAIHRNTRFAQGKVFGCSV